MATGLALWKDRAASMATGLTFWTDRAASMATGMTVSIGLLQRAVGTCLTIWKAELLQRSGSKRFVSHYDFHVCMCVLHFWLPRLYWQLDMISCSVTTLWIWIFFAWCWVICRSYYHLMCVRLLLDVPVAMCCIVVLGMGLNWIENDTWQQWHGAWWMGICMCCTCREMACGKH